MSTPTLQDIKEKVVVISYNGISQYLIERILAEQEEIYVTNT